MSNEKAPEAGQNKYNRLAGNTLIFAISSFSSKLLTFIVQPFLTYAMRDVENMGISKLLSQCANLLIPFVSMGMSNAIIRFVLDRGNDKKQVFTNGLLTFWRATACFCSAGRWSGWCPTWQTTAPFCTSMC